MRIYILLYTYRNSPSRHFRREREIIARRKRSDTRAASARFSRKRRVDCRHHCAPFASDCSVRTVYVHRTRPRQRDWEDATGGGGWRINVGLILRRTILNRTTDKARNDVTLRITGFSPRGGTMYSARKAVSNDSTIMCVFASLWGYPVYVCVRFARQRENAEATGYV